MRWLITPKDGQPVEYDSLALTLGETFELKRLAGLSISELQTGWAAQDPEAWRFAWYIAHQRAGIELVYSEIDFAWGDLTVTEIEDEPAAEEAADPDLPTGSTPDQETTTGDPTPSA